MVVHTTKKSNFNFGPYYIKNFIQFKDSKGFGVKIKLMRTLPKLHFFLGYGDLS